MEGFRHTAELDGVNYIDEIAASLGLRVVLLEIGLDSTGKSYF